MAANSKKTFSISFTVAIVTALLAGACTVGGAEQAAKEPMVAIGTETREDEQKIALDFRQKQNSDDELQDGTSDDEEQDTSEKEEKQTEQTSTPVTTRDLTPAPSTTSKPTTTQRTTTTQLATTTRPPATTSAPTTEKPTTTALVGLARGSAPELEGASARLFSGTVEVRGVAKCDSASSVRIEITVVPLNGGTKAATKTVSRQCVNGEAVFQAPRIDAATVELESAAGTAYRYEVRMRLVNSSSGEITSLTSNWFVRSNLTSSYSQMDSAGWVYKWS